MRIFFFTFVEPFMARQCLDQTVGSAGVAHSCSTGLTLFVTLDTVALLSR